MNVLCTIVDAEYLPLAKALHASLLKYKPGSALHVLVTDRKIESNTPGFITHSLEELSASPFFKGIEKKYAHTNPHSFRWALKPVFMGHLLETIADKIIFADADIYFINDYQFIFDELDHYHVLLTPHWANLDPTDNEDSLLAVMKGGLFNAGFIGASKKGREALSWWAGLCYYKTE